MTTETGTRRPSVDSPLVSVDWLAAQLDGDHPPIVLCASMGDPEPSRVSGVPGALLADIDADFSDPASILPHTVPADLPGLLERFGISDDSTVVVYDRHGLVVAPRVWWLLRMAGLDKIGVLDGGLPAWIAAGLPTMELSTPTGGGRITGATDHGLLRGASEVDDARERPGAKVIDARSTGRFLGNDPEPRPGLRRGHIPGSANLPFTELVDARGLLRPPAELASLFGAAAGDARELVFSCGSGVTACIDAFAAGIAGYRNVTVYDGSWAEWGNPDSGRPVARTAES
ncbi:sulfurtransferase [Corynebacterium pacaense]|uniref:sulfurtransferase n=1 Tax=Corynebacterium pacaense TaxID=1816684 RepID=UPI0009BA1A81|nr:sulfurtransferase [Corynebacterium pacaense]